MQDPFPIPAGVPTKAVVLKRGAIGELPRLLRELGVPRGRVSVVSDGRTVEAAGQQVEEVIEQAGYHPVRTIVVDDVRGGVTGTEEQLADVQRSHGQGLIIGVGSGVLNDLCKLAAKRAGKRYVSVATAASMNGYGSPIAAFIEGGVKRTLAAAPTEAIIADLDVIASAPLEMTRSGFADLLSKSSATADWMLAHLVRGEAYDPRPHELLDPVVKRCQAEAAAIGRADAEALSLLMQGLIYGAFAMVVAGHSAPASGGEHLISHLWDMEAQARHDGQPHALHGFQVAFGTRVASALYAKLMRLEAREIDVDAAAKRWRPWDEVRVEVRSAHGELADAVEPEAKKQFLERDALVAEVATVKARWDDIRATLRPLLLTPERIRELHATAGVPLHPEAVGQTRATLRHALLHAKDVRARFTVFDLASELGVLEAWADEVLEEAGIGK